MARLPEVMTRKSKFLDIPGKVHPFDVDPEHRLYCTLLTDEP
jgi:hypothetical protein